MLDRVQENAIQFVLILFDGMRSGGPPELVQRIGNERAFFGGRLPGNESREMNPWR